MSEETIEQYLDRVTKRAVTQAVDTLEEASRNSIPAIRALRMIRDEAMKRIVTELEREVGESDEPTTLLASEPPGLEARGIVACGNCGWEYDMEQADGCIKCGHAPAPTGGKA